MKKKDEERKRRMKGQKEGKEANLFAKRIERNRGKEEASITLQTA